jgi:hypothetical protein
MTKVTVAFHNFANAPKKQKAGGKYTHRGMPRAQLADSAHRHVTTHVTVYVSVGACALARDLDGLLRSGAPPSPVKVSVVHSLQHITECGNRIVCYPPCAFSQYWADLLRIIISIIPSQRQLSICEMAAVRLRYKMLESMCNKGQVKLYRPLEKGALLRMGPIGCPETSVRNYYHSLRNNPEERSSQLLRDGSL